MASRFLRPLALLLAALLAAGPLAVWAQAPEPASDDQTPEHEARLTKIDGTVYIHLQDQDDDQYVPAEEDASLDDGDMIRTGDDGTAELTLDGQSVIEISPNSDFIINSLAPEKTEFHVGIGAIVAKIKHLIQGEGMSFATPTAVASVRGTELGVSQEPGDEQAHVGVFDEGQVSVSMGKQTARLGPGQELALHKGQAIGRPGALSRFAASRQRMGALRARQAQLGQNWTRRGAQARQAARARLQAQRTLRASQLQRVRADMVNRRYQAQRARQQVLRQRHQQQLQKRAAARQARQQALQRRQQQSQEQQQRQQRQQQRQQLKQRRQEQQQRRKAQNQKRRWKNR